MRNVWLNCSQSLTKFTVSSRNLHVCQRGRSQQVATFYFHLELWSESISVSRKLEKFLTAVIRLLTEGSVWELLAPPHPRIFWLRSRRWSVSAHFWNNRFSESLLSCVLTQFSYLPCCDRCLMWPNLTSNKKQGKIRFEVVKKFVLILCQDPPGFPTALPITWLLPGRLHL